MSTADLRAELTQLDAQICELKRALVATECQRAVVHQQLREIATSPFLTLPAEITALIFTHCLPTIDKLRNSGPWTKFKDPPLVFLAVCRAWRDIALTTPDLWSELRLRFDHIPQDEEPAHLETHIHQWLGRAGHRPLSLIMGQYQWQYWDFDFPIARMRDIIHFYAPRIACLELYWPRDHIRDLALDTVAFPMLRHACITNIRRISSAGDPVEVFGMAPKLTQLTLGDMALPSFYVFPAFQFTKFQGHLDGLELFVLAPNLIEADCRTDEDCRVPSSPITHARLQSLTLSSPRGDPHRVLEPRDILPYLNLPELRTLDISAQRTTANPTSISQFVHRSGARLRTLVLAVKYYHAQPQGASDEWKDCLGRLRNTLQHLIVSPSEAFFKMILRSYLTLESLTIYEAPQIPYDDLIRQLILRIPHLKSFHISFQAGVFLEDEVSIAMPMFVDRPKDTARSFLAQLAKNAGMRIQIDSNGSKKTNRVKLIGSTQSRGTNPDA
ncbi:hypothetical protein FB45DRAFT_1024078 [Roridomyces roridus]|uniref:F-box domain-containing protein n=1 Tax=Roridomyces roridus TaxID=1738132 RepID=A0AAD7FVI7_9AGAR|nr:hypothetical protein FB45DRAFT_1024078 [Roridomyces roridus]